MAGQLLSSAVRISDLNDFIAPSQACVVTLKGQQKAAQDEVGLVGVDPARKESKHGLCQVGSFASAPRAGPCHPPLPQPGNKHPSGLHRRSGS